MIYSVERTLQNNYKEKNDYVYLCLYSLNYVHRLGLKLGCQKYRRDLWRRYERHQIFRDVVTGEMEEGVENRSVSLRVRTVQKRRLP